MFGKTLLEELKEASVSNEEAYVCYFNNGEVKTEERIVTERMNDFYKDDFIDRIKFIFRDSAQYYAMQSPYDNIKMNLELGLVFNKEDIDEENKIKENAKPINNTVRCYTSNITSFLNGEKANKQEYTYEKRGFLDYNKFIAKMKKDGISFEGPETFEDFKDAILAGETFDISLFADLKEKVENKEEQVQQEQIKEEPKKLVRKFFPSRRK